VDSRSVTSRSVRITRQTTSREVRQSRRRRSTSAGPRRLSGQQFADQGLELVTGESDRRRAGRELQGQDGIGVVESAWKRDGRRPDSRMGRAQASPSRSDRDCRRGRLTSRPQAGAVPALGQPSSPSCLRTMAVASSVARSHVAHNSPPRLVGSSPRRRLRPGVRSTGTRQCSSTP
jgi:hypothetical protein